ncbi:hypothetical protein PUV47_04585 [Pseudovibrio exalbescens]|uniref:DMT family transporter n=1 Tax=Pseudovibrio exalbescens TaxID=197461 RepID=UPI00236606A5|nr:hypothetical protein [Pseudovibrio exalbescens]MDD7909183.1 hypothetical protein [Pseudovibrio exalbescens]
MLAVLASAVGYGSIPYFALAGYAGNLTPEIAVVARYGFPALLLGWLLPRALKTGTGGKQFLLTGALMGLGAWSFFKALSLLPVTLAVLLFFSYPLFSLVARKLFDKKHIGKSGAMSAALVLLGIGLVWSGTSATQPLSLQGLAYGFLGPASYALVLHKMNQGADYLAPLQVAACLFTGTMLVVLPLLLLSSATQVMPEGLNGWGALLGLMLLTGIIPQMLMAYGAPIAGRVMSASAGGLECVTALILGSLAAARWPSLLEWGAMAAIVAALLLVSRLDKSYLDH